jgi:hypothetical protein
MMSQSPQARLAVLMLESIKDRVLTPRWGSILEVNDRHPRIGFFAY